jgi:hypothetical protein
MKHRHETEKSSCFMALCCGKNEKIEDTSFIFSDFYGNFLIVNLLKH